MTFSESTKMKRMAILAALFGAAVAPCAVMAETYEENVIAQLRGQGYVDIALHHTFLGRSQIIALNDLHRREIILDPHTGEILRDLRQNIMAANGSDQPGEDHVQSAPANARSGDAAATLAGDGLADRIQSGPVSQLINPEGAD